MRRAETGGGGACEARGGEREKERELFAYKHRHSLPRIPCPPPPRGTPRSRDDPERTPTYTSTCFCNKIRVSPPPLKKKGRKKGQRFFLLASTRNKLDDDDDAFDLVTKQTKSFLFLSKFQTMSAAVASSMTTRGCSARVTTARRGAASAVVATAPLGRGNNNVGRRSSIAPAPRALELDWSDPDTLVGALGGVLGIVVGIGAPLFYISRDKKDEGRVTRMCWEEGATEQESIDRRGALKGRTPRFGVFSLLVCALLALREIKQKCMLSAHSDSPMRVDLVESSARGVHRNGVCSPTAPQPRQKNKTNHPQSASRSSAPSTGRPSRRREST